MSAGALVADSGFIRLGLSDDLMMVTDGDVLEIPESAAPFVPDSDAQAANLQQLWNQHVDTAVADLEDRLTHANEVLERERERFERRKSVIRTAIIEAGDRHEVSGIDELLDACGLRPRTREASAQVTAYLSAPGSRDDMFSGRPWSVAQQNEHYRVFWTEATYHSQDVDEDDLTCICESVTREAVAENFSHRGDTRVESFEVQHCDAGACVNL